MVFSRPWAEQDLNRHHSPGRGSLIACNWGCSPSPQAMEWIAPLCIQTSIRAPPSQRVKVSARQSLPSDRRYHSANGRAASLWVRLGCCRISSVSRKVQNSQFSTENANQK